MRPLATGFTAALLVAAGGSSLADTAPVEALAALLASLDAEQREELQRPFDDDDRRDWTYLPWGHHGTALRDMSGPQRARVDELLATALSDAGVATIRGIITLEEELHRETWFKPFRDPGRYSTVVFGTPEEPAWGWRFGGHHISVNLTAVAGTLSGTPFFTGANPARVETGPNAGLRVLAREEDDARALASSLDPAQFARALLDEDAPWDIVTGRDPVVELACCEGLPASDMSQSQQQALLGLVHLMTSKLRADIAADLEGDLAGPGLGNLHFAWAGSLQAGEGHYYRIQGDRLLIEYDNTQGDANHIHLVLRDLTGDFGEDLLRRHYREQRH